MSRAIRGLDAVLYVSTNNGTTWIECGSARDVELNANADTIDVSRRGNVYRQYLVGLRDFTISGTMIKDDTDAGYLALKAAADGATVLTVMVLDGDKDASTPAAAGYQCNCFVGDWTEAQQLEEGITVDFSLVNDPSDDPAPVTGPIPPPA